MESVNRAAWSLEPKGDLKLSAAPYSPPSGNELVIKNYAVAIQPLDANIRGRAYLDLPYPFILGNGVAGVVEEVGSSVTKFKKGDRVVSDTPAYHQKIAKYGGWQKYVVSTEATTSKIPAATTFEDAAAIPFALLTAVAALSLKLGMERPGSHQEGRVLIWSASGSVGAYAVQYASSVGYDVVATASPGKFDYVRSLGASEVVDYRDEQAVSKLKALGPYKFVMTASGDAAGAHAISDILQPEGGVFASTRPQSEEMHLADNVELLYDYYSMATQKPENAAFSKWWYEEYLPVALAGGVTPTPLEKRAGGLSGIQNACEDIINGRSPKKLVLNPQEDGE
ncbi:putative alcohol dehydrogenase [Aspergillus nomiae NRRL 13137]|uniref:Putative alcohol dehydrogenase n=1 Tax=Aspergillus nomiae NRRL (strain ATCC 15546 / NRRL 13137 / CBS 260.88 / M93) TaxID=1509407 RepID=A0A0L1IXG2_ASPN3|nr:putative alcohol dehydrogenase [Aspergillus nomiae NRRL 13137]KNG84184.1 putative alcohol dehydrogenase [Aspergillus nomiae NRRL 13137]